MNAAHIFLLMVLQCIYFWMAQAAIYNINLGDLYKMQNGIGWPETLNVFVGHDALLKLPSSFDNQQSCEVTTPEGTRFDVQRPPNNRYEIWGDGCGVRVKNVIAADHGRWRLTTVRGNDSITGWTEVYVEENINNYQGDPIILHDGQTHTTVELSTLANSYCLVAQPFSESSLVPGHCSVTLDRTTRAVQGNWHVLMGLPGRISELQVDRSIAVKSERLDGGFIHGPSNKLHLYCNIENTSKNITFCRFQKTTDRAGYNVIDGLSDGTHSYYGEGFAKRQCGMTIELPTASDIATWRCTVGVQEWYGTVIQQRTPLQALIRVTTYSTQSSHTIIRDSDDLRLVFVQKDKSFTIPCQADASLSYCWFQHPNGSQYTPTERASEDQPFWYSGENLHTGDCSITFNHVTEDESGVWTCHMGPRDEVGVEYTDEVDVRVTGPLAARQRNITGIIGYILPCTVTRPMVIEHCLIAAFLLLNLWESVLILPSQQKSNAVLGRFFFTSGRDLNYGDCSLTISPVLAEDMGEWTCAAIVDGETLESRDTIYVLTEVATQRSEAGVIGMSIGGAALIIVLAGVLTYRHRSKLTVPWRRTNNTERTDNVSIEMRMDRISLGSATSSTSSSGTVSSDVGDVSARA